MILPNEVARHRKRAMLVVGEASGDIHGANLVKALTDRDPEMEVFGVGGESLRQTKFETLLNVSQLTGMGLVELVGNLGNLWRGYRVLQGALKERNPDLLILIDFPEFNLRLARLAKRLRIPVLYYISPQVWAWRRGRVRDIARRVDHMAVVFPFEVELYEKHGVPVSFVGHPLLDLVRAEGTREETLKALGLEPKKRTIALLPGSRKREVGYHLPVMLEAAERLSAECEVQFVVVRASTVERVQLETLLEQSRSEIPIVVQNRYDALGACDLAWTASGTVTLETALMLKPMIVMYRLSWITYALARLLVNVKQIGMVNIIAGEEVVPELIQADLTAEKIVRESRRFLENPEIREEVIRKLSVIKNKLGSPGAAGRVADLALNMMS